MQERRKGDRKYRLLAICCLLASSYFGLFVWPTPWRYDRVGKNPIRTNRVTGDVEILNLQGWQPALPQIDLGTNAQRRLRPPREVRPCEPGLQLDPSIPSEKPRQSRT
jgi:hypothetical protein